MKKKEPEHIRHTVKKLMNHYLIRVSDDKQFKKLLEELDIDPSKCEPEELIVKLTEHMKMTIRTIKHKGGGLSDKT